MIFAQIKPFEKDLKTLLKKYRTLHEDLEVVKQVLSVFPDERPPFSYRINELNLQTCVIKVKKIACKALKGKGVQSGLRLVYAWHPEELKITFIELYHKNEQAQENRLRIAEYFT